MEIQSKQEICVPWQQSNTPWNEICAMVVEQFGLPGDRWTYHPLDDQMKFFFISDKDALMCKILLSEFL